jgi:preprotein translocase subunit SecG
MATLLLIVHVIVCFFLIFIVLLQSGKGAELGAAFGGSNQTIFGSRGAATFLNKMTTVAAVIFMLTSLSLAVVTAKGVTVVKKIPVTEEKRSIPATSSPVQGGSTQPVQPSQQGPQTQQKVPQTPQQTPTK